MYRVNVYIDGFNFYHAIDELKEEYLKWTNLWALSEKLILKNQALNKVKYFSAYATWLPNSYKRHRDYVAANKVLGVTPIMGRFKERRVKCKAECKQEFLTHEEKETDVNIGAHLVADALNDDFDTALVISADTDLAAVVKLVRELVGEKDKRIITVAPPGRFSRGRELEFMFSIPKGKIKSSQLPDVIQNDDGEIIRPDKYKISE